ncbi:MAG: DUF4405 domain-containing protein [Coriobacteriales bacterium]|nr:DUF4405 domain-containing protein [Coriobacteriales bacterium]
MTRTLLIIDAIATVVYLLVANPLVTGLAIHEWLSLGCIVVFVVHTAIHHEWLHVTFAAIRNRAWKSNIGHLLLDSATLIVFMVATVSGLMVSRHILPAFGLVARGYFFWNPLHSISAKLLLALLLVHVVTHIPWLLGVIKSKRKITRK